jgi:NitT/TauT family transport system permease protein
MTVDRSARRGWSALPRRRPPRARPAIFSLKVPLGRRTLWLLTAGSFIGAVLFWWLLSISGLVEPAKFLPTPFATWQALVAIYQTDDFWPDIIASIDRVFIGYGISVALSVPLGIFMGSFRAGWALLEPVLGLLRYLPAPAFIPLLIVWFDLDERPKWAVIILGTFFFNTLMTADVVRTVPKQLIDVSYTLGARTGEVLRKVIIPHSLPGIIDAVRVNAAAAWGMVVVAELIAADQGLGVRINRLARFQFVDKMFAILVVIGLIGVILDVSLRLVRDRVGRWQT